MGLVSACFMDCVLTYLSLVGNTLKHAAVSQVSFGLFDCSELFLSCVPYLLGIYSFATMFVRCLKRGKRSCK